MDRLIHRRLREDIMPAEVLQAVRDILARDSRPGHSIGQTIDYLMDRLFYGEFQILEQVSSNRYHDHVNLIGIKDPGTGQAPLWLLGHLGSGAEPIPADWRANGGSPDPGVPSPHHGLLYGLGAANAKVDILLKLLVAARVDKERLRRPLYVIGLSGDEAQGPGLDALLDGRFPSPGAALIGAPTNLELWTSHPGSVTLRLTTRRALRHRRMPPCRGMFELSVTGRSAHAQCPGAGVDALSIAFELLDRLREHGELRVLSLSAGEGAKRLAGQARLAIATSFETLPVLPAQVRSEALPDGASVPFPIDRMLGSWRRAHDAGVAAVRASLGLEGCVPAARPMRPSHTGWLRSERDALSGEVTLWTGPGVEQRPLLESFAEAAHAQLRVKDECELEIEVVQQRRAFEAGTQSAELVAACRDTMSGVRLPVVESAAPYVSDAGRLASLGVPTVLFGPGRGIGGMYQDDECVPLVHLSAAYRTYEALIERWCC